MRPTHPHPFGSRPVRFDHSAFAAESRRAGECNLARGSVSIIDHTPRRVRARVDDTPPATVTIGLPRSVARTDESHAVSVECSCVRSIARGECRHGWAVARFLGLVTENDLSSLVVRERLDRHANPDDEGAGDDRSGAHGSGAHRSGDDEREPPQWETIVDRMQPSEPHDGETPRWPLGPTGSVEVLFWLSVRPDGGGSGRVGTPLVEARERWNLGSRWGKPHTIDLAERDLARRYDRPDLDRIELLARLDPLTHDAAERTDEIAPRPRCRPLPPVPLESPLGRATLTQLAASGRLLPHGAIPEDVRPIAFESEPWSLRLEFDRSMSEEQSRLRARLVRGSESIGASSVLGAFSEGVIWTPGVLAPIDDPRHVRWIAQLGGDPVLVRRAEERACALGILERDPETPIVLPEGEESAVIRVPPRPCLVVRRERRFGRRPRLYCSVYFDYGDGVVLDPGDDLLAVRHGDTVIARHRDAELEQIRTLLTHGARRSVRDEELEEVTVAARRLPALIDALLPLGWRVEAEGRVHRAAGDFDIQVTSGVDWLDLEGEARFEGQTVSFPRLLGAIRRGQRLVPLGDGSVGVLPIEWLRRTESLARMGLVDGDAVRYSHAQAGLLDELLTELPEVSVDATFTALRERIARFEGIEPQRERRSFRGTLRPYQRKALGWFSFLRELGFGGCLADDMGLGKTVQVIALLENLRLLGELSDPALIIAPRSVIENWQRELARFAPRLRTLDLSGPDRSQLLDRLDGVHVALTTYAVLRRDILDLRARTFDTVILDEAQAIKNRKSQTAKAARLLDARHRLALTGTPIENSLTDLWSLFDFLQPGLLGSHAAFARVLNAAKEEAAEGETSLRTEACESKPSTDSSARSNAFAPIARAVRPFILRRTKAQVAPDLPARIEQTIECPLPPRQRALYHELLLYYRRQLLPELQLKGLSTLQPQILEAIVRLRQAACHPGLLDADRTGETSGKLPILIDRIIELRAEGQRCLVFSQFTQYLRLVRAALEERGISTQYLDGATTARQAEVDRFQSEEGATAFLISLKAGGVGLNLTAASTVFLLDPWWNPAVEAQAIDRAHRIGRVDPVLALRLIAPDTIEEKVLLLQDSKRTLADAVIRAEDGWVGSLSAEDLAHLFSW